MAKIGVTVNEPSLIRGLSPEIKGTFFSRNLDKTFTVCTEVPGFRVLGFGALLGFRALKAGDRAWSVHKTLFGFRAPLSQLFI